MALNAEGRARRDIIERLICDLHVGLAPFQTVEGSPDDGFASERARLASMVDDGLAHINGDNIKVNEEGCAFVRSVCAVFDTYLQTSKGRHSSAV